LKKKVDAMGKTCLLLFMIEVCLTASAQKGSDSLAGYVKLIDNFLIGSVFENDMPGGNVLAIKNGSVIYKKAFGFADVSNKLPMNTEMLMPVGSVSKNFTAMAINYLVMTGKLSFDDDIALYLKDFHSGDKKISVRNLLTHTSGIIDLHKISNYFPGELGKKYSPADLIEIFNGHSLEFDPGQGYSYSNSGYILLAQIIEKVTGEEYETFINQNLLLPLNMSNTQFSGNDSLQPDIPLGYDIADNKVTTAKYLHPSHLYGGGAIKTNLDDMIKWYSFLKNLREDHEQNFIEITTPFTLGNGNSSNSSLGWFNGEIKGHKMLYHGGGIYGFNTHILFIPEGDFFIAIMKNYIDKYGTPGIEMTANYIAAILLNEISTTERVSIELTLAEKVKYQGRYWFNDTKGSKFYRDIILENNKLFYSGGGTKTEILPETKTTFFVQGAKSYVTFEFSEYGEVESIVLHQGGIYMLTGKKE
jgi:CubicO group peptidase (beta-lactamase class C family)